MKRNPVYITICLCVILFTAMFPACNGNQNPSPPPVYPNVPLPTPSEDLLLEGLNYHNEEFGFSLKYCKDLELIDYDERFTVILLGDVLKDLKHYINFYVDVVELPKKQTFEEYVDLSLKVAEESLADFAVVEEYNTTIDNRVARVVVVTFTEIIEEEEWPYKDMFVLIQKDNLIYAIRFNTPDEFREEYIDCFNLLLNTFTIQ